MQKACVVDIVLLGFINASAIGAFNRYYLPEWLGSGAAHAYLGASVAGVLVGVFHLVRYKDATTRVLSSLLVFVGLLGPGVAAYGWWVFRSTGLPFDI